MTPDKQMKVTQYAHLNRYAEKGQILFAGSSLCEFFPIYELQFHHRVEKRIYNRGIGGFTTDELLEALEECVLQLEPRTLFINIGTNDLSRETAPFDNMFANYREILRRVRECLPQVKLYVMAYYPVNQEADFGLSPEDRAGLFGVRTNESIAQANRMLPGLAAEFGGEFIDVNRGLTDENGNLKAEFAIEGMHMWANAYEQVLENLLPYLENA